MFTRKKKHLHPTSVPANGFASSQVQSRLQSSQEEQQPQHASVCPWSAHAPQFGQSPSPFLRKGHTLSTRGPTGELFLFGGHDLKHKSRGNDLYAISTRDFSTNLLKTSGDVPDPRHGHCAVLTGNTLLIWGGKTDSSPSFGDHNAQNQSNDDSLYLLNLVSREWTRVVINGPGPGRRHFHTMMLVRSKLFVFGGLSANGAKKYTNDTWAFDLDRLKSNPFWELYEPTPGNEQPPPRANHVSVTTGDRIIIFGGCAGPKLFFNDTWSFNTSTRKWTTLQCTGPIPSPRAHHAAVLVDDVMYVFGGRTIDGTILGDLTALNLSTQRWTVFQHIGPSLRGRKTHAMASDGRYVFVIGGELSPSSQVDEDSPIHVLDTTLLIYPKPDSNTVKHNEKTTELAQKLSAGHATHNQPQHGAFPFQIAPSEDIGHPNSPQITRELNTSLNDLPFRPKGASSMPRRAPDEDGDGEGSTEHHAELVAPEAPSGKEIARLDDGRHIGLERQPSGTLVAKTERDRRIAQLTDELALKSALLEQAAEEKTRAELAQCELQAKLDELLLSRDQAEANLVADEKKRARLDQRELQAKLDELTLSRDQALEQAQSALQKATSRAAEANEKSQRELAEVHAKLEARESELAAVRLRLMDAEVGWAKSKAEAETLRAGTQAAADLVNVDVERVMRRLMERVRSVEAEMASLRGDEKSIGDMKCSNEG